MSVHLSRREALHLAGAATVTGLAATRAVGQSAPGSVRTKKIALEEHCMFPDFVGYLAETKQNILPSLFDKAVPVLSDFGDRRLEVMDANGVDFVVLSIAGPGVQIEPDTAKALRLARSANDRLAVQVQKRPTRYGGFAHLALQNPEAAADELERCMHDLHFSGALINGETNGFYLDDPRYDVFWERVSALKAAIYIHPGNPQTMAAAYADHPELWGPTWSWAAETCTHALRLIFRGTFDRYPDARLILGHMGETLPIQRWRLDSRYPISNHRYRIEKLPSDYLRSNVFITTSGVCSDAALRCALDEIGPRNVMFSVDYPFEDTKTACDWIEGAKLTDAERQAVAHGNAAALLRLTV
ncbi:amidohydrolase family protein [Robbsia sp. Bb-Pol-6]|uniref:Amidohydrolase family protein n=1 Tax=Robbsia betulipollinis TaxID=2981849 RepID=A0ABT3ZUL9_9BURK|nr:amidohydrolase family protein [Robbsia betulipollinis]MCY0389538.1 amidohydrolase family protein [Robbsia betulipollinis]